ncbi:MAG: hypothetical protein HRU14_11180 [Planctomycetes bacterium]|nr:hypothetical protein [Planctomycetota bacterium]
MGRRGYGAGLPALLLFGSGLLALLLFGSGGEPGPGAVLEAWLEHLVCGEIEDAFDLLSTSSRQALAEAEAAWIAGRGHPLAPKDSPPRASDGPAGLILFRRLVAGPGFHGIPPLPADAADRVESETIEGNLARVRVRTTGGTHEAHLVRENGSWRVAALP